MSALPKAHPMPTDHRSNFRFRISHMLWLMAGVAVLLVVYMASVREQAKAESKALEFAYHHGVITKEEARKICGDLVDTWTIL